MQEVGLPPKVSRTCKLEGGERAPLHSWGCRTFGNYKAAIWYVLCKLEIRIGFRTRTERQDGDMRTFLIIATMLLCAGLAAAQDEQEAAADGSGEYISLTDLGTTPKEADGKLTLDFDNADIKFVAEKIAKLTGKNMMIENNITGKVTLITENPVSKEEAFNAFISALNLKGYTVVQQGPYFKIIHSRNIKKTAHPTLVGDDAADPVSDLYVTKLISIKNVPAKDIENTLRTFVSNRNIKTHEATNVLIVTDTASNIARIERIIRELDVPGFSERIEFVVLKNAVAKDVAQKLTSMFGTGAGGGGGSSKGVTKVAATGKGGTASDIIITSIMADDRTNSLMIKGNERGIEAIRSATMHLDSDLAGNLAKQEIFIFQLEHADAPKIAETLSGILNGLTSKKGGQLAQGKSFSRFSFRPASGEDATTTLGGIAEDVKISADEKTNSLIIVATRMAYEAILPTITALDRKRKQVEIAATIMEVTLGDGSAFGISGYGGGGKGKVGFMAGANPGSAIGVGTSAEGGANMAQLGGLVAGIGTTSNINLGGKFSIPSFMATLNASASNSSAQILANPRLVTHDNEKAEISVGNVVWIKSGYQKSAEGGMTDYRFDKEKATLDIVITPKINKSNEVTLKIDQDVKDLVPMDNRSDPNLPDQAISQRTIKTVVMAKSGETIAIGGLIKDKENKSVTKVPVLGDIPVLGWLFKSEQKSVSKTNLILFLTPTVLDSAGDRKMVTQRAVQKRNQHMVQNKVQIDNWIGTDENNTHPAGITINWNSAESNEGSAVLFEDEQGQ